MMIQRSGIVRKTKAMGNQPLAGISILVGLMVVMPSWVSGIGSRMGTLVTLSKYLDNDYSLCALQTGTLHPFCWGPIFVSPLKPTPSVALWAITAGDDFVCGLLFDSHHPICWGINYFVINLPSSFSITSYSSINAGLSHVCAVRDNSTLTPGTVDCWGDNSPQHQLESPVGISMISITAGLFHTCGLTVGDRKVVCWGNPDHSVMPSRLSESQFIAIFATYFHTCGILASDNTTECWEGRTSISNPSPVHLFSMIAGTFDTACGLLTQSHEVICWPLTPTHIPLPSKPYPLSYISTTANFRNTSGGVMILEETICGLREDIDVGNVNCWGTSQNPYESHLSTFSASKGLCMLVCPKDHYAVPIDGQCPNPQHKVCLRCNGTCPLPPPIPPSPAPPPASITPLPNPNNSIAPPPPNMGNKPERKSSTIILVAITVVSLLSQSIW